MGNLGAGNLKQTWSFTLALTEKFNTKIELPNTNESCSTADSQLYMQS